VKYVRWMALPDLKQRLHQNASKCKRTSRSSIHFSQYYFITFLPFYFSKKCPLKSFVHFLNWTKWTHAQNINKYLLVYDHFNIFLQNFQIRHWKCVYPCKVIKFTRKLAYHRSSSLFCVRSHQRASFFSVFRYELERNKYLSLQYWVV